jgi:CHAT domain-containing protein/Tfp pilus assembly protein PilF
MRGRLAFFLLAFLVNTAFEAGGPPIPPGRIRTVYQRSDRLFRLPQSTTKTDSQALAGFIEVISNLSGYPDFPGKDTLLFQSWLKKGILLDAASDFSGARDAYCKAISLHRQNDSLSFVAAIYAGASYYNLNNFDSANYFLQQAESNVGRFQDREDEVRLYNTLGVLYYDNGNYQLGKNYFEKALEIVRNRKPLDTFSAVSLQTNIATSYYQLGQYRESLTIYRKILGSHLFADPIYINMGRAFGGLGNYEEAMACYRKINPSKLPAVFNEMGYTEWQMHRADSSLWYLDQLLAYSKKNKEPLNELDLAINDMYRADPLAGRQQFMEALARLQHSIIIFSRNFSNTDIYANPSNFTGTFAYYGLFDALFKKAGIFGALYKKLPKEPYLLASYEAYKAALALLRTIEKSYDTDDAKLFLKKRSGEAYAGALSTCLDLYRHHPEGPYLEQAFNITEKSKASVITSNLEEKTFVRAHGVGESLLQKERNIKYNIARLHVKSESTVDPKDLEAITREKIGYEIELTRLQKELEQDDEYYKLKYDDSSPEIKEIQQSLDKSQALISFYAAGEVLHAFILTRSSFGYCRIDSLRQVEKETGDWLSSLKRMENGRKFKGDVIGDRLYRQLIQPLKAILPHKDEWIILPDGFLYFLPFESLPAGEDSKRLLETTTISYQFSARLLMDGPRQSKSDQGPPMVLSFAPFAGAGLDSSGFDRLPASQEEIAGLPGARYIDGMATKTQFLQAINKYPIIHLATHATSSATDAAQSFIAFYPVTRDHTEDCLYLEELYGLNMNSTQLVIISACESGKGELAGKEGVISLSRAFAYAGCASTINSLWKADDKATSFILQRFYVYLEGGATKARALQRAKLDYLASDAINKSPSYWAHLVLIGNIRPLYPRQFNYAWLMMLVPASLGVVSWKAVRRWRRKKEKVDVLPEAGS